MTQNVAIIGCGYVGSAVARCWQPQGLTVTATTTTPSRIDSLAEIADRAVILHGSDASALETLLRDQDVVLLSIGAPNSDAYAETYLSTAKTLAAVLPKTPRVRQVIYTGSYAVYGDQQGNWVTEETPVDPVNRNSEILVETEQVLLSAATDRRHICILRLGGIYGAGRELIKIFRRAAGTTRPGDGSEASNWVHLEDIVGAIDLARQQQLQGIYNLVQDNPPTVKMLLDRLFATHQLQPVTWDATQTSRRAYNAKVSNQKLKQAGYSFIHSELAL